MSKNLADKLSIALADSYSSYLKLQNYHWNVEGEHFFELHNLFQTYYEELALSIDVIAEQIRTLGYKAPGSFSFYAKLTNVSEPKIDVSGNEMLHDIKDTFEILIKTFDSVLHEAGDNLDVETMATDRISELKKHLWMIKSSLK